MELIAGREQDRPPAIFDPHQSAGLFVGVSDFSRDGIPAAEFTVDDAVDLAYLFALELGLVSPDRILLLLSGRPQKDDSNRRLDRLKQEGAIVGLASHSDILSGLDVQSGQVGAGGMLIIAFATHGVSDQGMDYLLAADSVDGHLPETSLNVDKVIDTVIGAATSRKIVLLDACREVVRSGSPRGPEPRFSLGEEFARILGKSEGEVILSAARPHGSAYPDPHRKNGVFTAAVLDGLRCQATPDPQGQITAGQLVAFVHQRVVAWVKENRPAVPPPLRGIEWRIGGDAARLPLAHCSAPKLGWSQEQPSTCQGTQLDFVEIHAGPAGVHKIVPPATELSLPLQKLSRVQNLAGKAFLRRNGVRIEDCRCRWEQLDPESGGWLELEGERNACTFSLNLPQTASDVVLHLTVGEGFPTQLLLHVR